MNLVTALVTPSDIVDDGFPEIALNPVKTLPTTSEGTRLSSGNFPAPLLIESAIVEARLSVSPLNPVKALDTASEMVGVYVNALISERGLAMEADKGRVSVRHMSHCMVLA